MLSWSAAHAASSTNNSVASGAVTDALTPSVAAPVAPYSLREEPNVGYPRTMRQPLR